MFTCDLYINICAHTHTLHPGNSTCGFIQVRVGLWSTQNGWRGGWERTSERGHRGERERPVSMFRVTELHIFHCLHTGILMRDVHKEKRGSERTGKKFRKIYF